MSVDRFGIRRTLLCFVLGLAMAPCPAAEYPEVRVAFGASLHPYVISENNSGIEYDIIREALESEGYRMVPVYVPFKRLVFSMRYGEVDAASTMQESAQVQAYYSDSHIVYRNYAISLARNGYRIDSVADLANYSVDAFQTATVFLGPQFAAAVAHGKHYGEHADQAEQNRLLYLGRTDVVIADINIFKYNEADQADLSAHGIKSHDPVAYHEIFPPTPYKVAFASASVRDAFNRGLAKLRKSGEYERIFERYVSAGAAKAGERH